MPNKLSRDTETRNDSDNVTELMPNGHAPLGPTVEYVETSQTSEIGSASFQESDQHDDIDSRPPKKQKLDHSSSKARAKQPSPPWKAVKVDGPTSFMKDGRRKSSRTNAVPLDLQPKGNRATTRSALHRSQISKVQPTPNRSSSLASRQDRRQRSLRTTRSHPRLKDANVSSSSSTPKATKISGVHQKSSASSLSSPSLRHMHRPGQASSKDRPVWAHRHSHRRRHSERSLGDGSLLSPKPITNGPSPGTGGFVKQIPIPAHPPLLRLRFTKPPLPILNPKNVVRPKKFRSLEEWSKSDDPLEGEEELNLSETKIRQEARLLNRLDAATQPGGLLSEERRALRRTVPQPEPSYQYNHLDYLLAHVKDLQPRLERERKEHQLIAKKLAHAAAAKWKEKNKTPEQLEKELIDKQLAHYKRVRHELQKVWEHALAEAKKTKLQWWHEEEQARGTKELDSMLEKKTRLLLERQRGRYSFPGSEDERMQNDVDEDEDSQDDSTEDDDPDSDVMSDSSNSSDEFEDSHNVGDDDLTVEELHRKYENIPEDLVSNTNLDRSTRDSSYSEEHEQSHSLEVEMNGDGDADAEPYTISVDADDLAEDDHYSHSFQANDGSTLDLSQLPLEEVADELMDSSESSSDSDDSGTELSSSEEEESEEESVAEGNLGLLGFFSAPTRNRLTHLEDDQAETVAVEREAQGISNDGNEEGDIVMENVHAAGRNTEHEIDASIQSDLMMDRRNNQSTSADDAAKRDSAVHFTSDSKPSSHATPEGNLTSGAPSEHVSGATNTSAPPSVAESTTSVEPAIDQYTQNSLPMDGQASQITSLAVPELLRGTLREYQHYGLEWLAGLYANNTNGILADEMGLGKTIQTIALLAHLAVEHQIWGPHLIVVPTSVILNWVVEFKRWCPGFKVLPYYGTQKERDAKRKGWSDENAWNVCITSYQLALQDVKSLKRKNWHYMVLDEAHNIKNFRSKRWETLLTFKTEARLLLTGTPLQNNLTELWSLLFFIAPGTERLDGTSFSDLEDFNRMFKRPADAILDYGREALDDKAREIVAKLHQVLRPHLLRRLKQDVEKQMPPKYEHIVPCRLSKRQRQLYDGYMRRADTRAKLSSGNYMSMINVLMQLRKVCNHPDLFETRPIVTSFAMNKSAVADFEIKELLIRKRLMEYEPEEASATSLFSITSREAMSKHEAHRQATLAAVRALQTLTELQRERVSHNFVFDGSSTEAGMSSLEEACRQSRLGKLTSMSQYVTLLARLRNGPIYGRNLIQTLTIKSSTSMPKRSEIADSFLNTASALQNLVLDLSARSRSMETAIQKFGCVTPAVVASGMPKIALTREIFDIAQLEGATKVDDPFHEARTRLSIAFPDKGLIQYDYGKLQRLALLLRNLEAGGHRALIFTQMTKILDILEQFLNLHGYRYLRLDGQTKLEQRQIMTERFNNDPRITVMILSSRSGGLGINLTGADSVIFYDLDWNPAMDKQCQDRCHRIGQTREVHIFRFVSQGTIEANIIRKSNQKRMLDDVFIQEGQFTTEYFNNMNLEDGDSEAGEALDKVLGVSESATVKLLEEAEDQEDVVAARNAQQEAVHDEDAADFEDKIVAQDAADTPKAHPISTPLGMQDSDGTPMANTTAVTTPLSASTPLPVAQPTPTEVEPQLADKDWTGVSIASRLGESYDERDALQDADSRKLINAWLIPMQLWELRGIVIVPASELARRKLKKVKDHTVRIRR